MSRVPRRHAGGRLSADPEDLANPALAAVMARPATVNGLPGFVLRETDGSIDTMTIDHRDGRIAAIYLVRNPDKLQHVLF